MSSTQVHVRSLSLKALVVSQTPMQIERRKMRTKEQVQQRADSMKSVGVLHPITVRPNPHPETIKSKDGSEIFEIVAGEGRYLSAGVAGLKEIPAIIRELTDDQVEEIQLIENLQRDDVHELVEALGYETLLKRGHTAEQIASETGKSKGTVYARLKLLALSEAARKAFVDGALDASKALLIARIPGEELQQRALKVMTEKDYHDRSMSYRDAVKYVHDTFHLKLSGAPFDTEDAALVAGAGACGACPMRTGNQPALFPDVKSEDVCTNPPCFQEKKTAHIKAALEKAKATGERVIRGGEARRVLPPTNRYIYSSDGGHKHLRNGYARPSDVCPDDPKGRTYAELAGKDAPKVLLQNPDTGAVSKVFEIETIRERLKEKGIKPPPKAEDREEQRKQDHQRAEQAETQKLQERRAIFRAVIDAAPTKLGKADLANLISKQYEQGYGNDEDFYDALGWEKPKGAGGREKFREQLLKLSEGELAQLAVAMPLINAVLDLYDNDKELEAAARRFKVDTKKIRADIKAVAAKAASDKTTPVKIQKKAGKK